jgi:hypothetical protein
MRGRGRLPSLALVLALGLAGPMLLATAAPAAPPGGAQAPPVPTAGEAPGGGEGGGDGKGDAELTGAIGGGSPFCAGGGLSGEVAENCRRTHALERAYPLASFGLDNNVETGLRKVKNFFPSALQSIAAVVWQALLLTLNGVLLLLQWAFSLDLFGQALGQVREALGHLDQDVLGGAWLLAGLSIAGLWGIWNGLVRLRTIETAAALGFTVLLICAAQLIIHRPDLTVVWLSRTANESSLDALALASGGSVEDPAEGYAEASKDLFNALVLRPWCALEFGDVGFCSSRPGKICVSATRDPGLAAGCRPFAGTVADAWLTFPAGSAQREALFNYLHASDPAHARLQDVDGTASRFGLLLLIALGDAGAIGFLLYLATQILVAAVTTLVLLLWGPFALVMPAFGEAGRNAAVTWLKRLGGAAVAKFVYSVFLAFVVLVATIIAGLDGIGWYGKWMVLIVFWWGMLLKRKELVGFVMPAGSGGGNLLSSLFYGRRMAGEAARIATGVPRLAWRRGTRTARWARDRAGSRREAGSRALQRDATHALGRRAEAAVKKRKEEGLAAAEATGSGSGEDRGRREDRSRRAGALDEEIGRARGRRDALRARYEELRSQPRGTVGRRADTARMRRELAAADEEVAALDRRRLALDATAARDGRRSGARADGAEGAAGSADGVEVREYEVRDWIAARKRELSASTARDPESERDRELIRRAAGTGLSRGSRKQARREVRRDPGRSEEVKRWTRELRAEATRDRRLQRRRGRLGRR